MVSCWLATIWHSKGAPGHPQPPQPLSPAEAFCKRTPYPERCFVLGVLFLGRGVRPSSLAPPRTAGLFDSPESCSGTELEWLRCGNSFSRNSRLSQTNFCARNCCVGRTDRHLMGSPKPRLRVGAFFIRTPRIERALAGWGSSSTRAQSPPHSVWRDREAAVPSMLSLILWRLSNALVHAKAGSRADSCYFGNRSPEARLWLAVASPSASLRGASERS